MIVNLNTLCKVQLNDQGKKIWLSQIEELPEDIRKDHPEIVQSIKNKIDSDNCVEIELWGLMNLFGPYISPVTSPFTTTTIEINKNPNFGNFFPKENNTK